jgi:tetratricopeptide (TPR) repeat protein
MTQIDLMELAKLGDPKVIAALINHKLQPENITAKALVQNGCLQIMLESFESPNWEVTAKAICKSLLNLGIKSIQKVKIYGRRTGEDIPEWHEEFEIATQKPSLEELALQRDVEAIAALISQWFQPHKITVKASIKNDCLQVMLEAKQVPDLQVAVSTLKDGLIKLGIHPISKIKLYGKQTEEEFPEWHQEFCLDWSTQSPAENTSFSIAQESISTSNTPLKLNVDIIKVSNSIYSTLEEIFYQPIFNRIKLEEEENSIHEIVEAFNIEILEEDLERATSLVGKELPILAESFSIRLSPVQTKAIITEIYTSQISDLRVAIKQMNKVIQEVLKFDFPQETDELKAFFRGALDGVMNGIAQTSSPAPNETIIGAVIGSFIAPGLGTIIGSAVGGWFAGNRQNQEIQAILEKYDQAREKVFQEWRNLWKITYENICLLIFDKSSIELITYQIFQQSDSFLEQGNEFCGQEKFTEAINFYEQALRLNPQFSMAWNNKGYALEKLDLDEEAISSFDKAIEIDNNILALNNKVDILQKVGEDEKAIIICNQLLKIEPDNYQFLLCKAISLKNLKNYEKLLQVLDLLISLEPENYIGWYGKASCLALMMEVKRAIENLEEAILLNPTESQQLAKDDLDFDGIRNDDKFKALMESSVGIDYSNLKKLLVDKKWQEADKETAKLMCLAVTNQEKRLNIIEELAEAYTELSVEKIENLLSTDLHTINNLWLEYSENKFGFSIQKKIYESLGGTQEFNGDIRDKFGKITDWRVCQDSNYSWRRSDKFIYDDKKAPKGHLPSCLWAGFEDGWFENRRDCLIALFAHMDVCSID